MGLKFAFTNNPNNTVKEPNETKIAYYIFDTAELNLYGIFDIEEFQKQKYILYISENMILKDVGSYSKSQ